jgi:hypothetical protein
MPSGASGLAGEAPRQGPGGETRDLETAEIAVQASLGMTTIDGVERETVMEDD